MDFSVGQIITPNVDNSQILTSGFQQPENNTTKDTPESEFINYELNVFPNPTNTYTNITITSEFEIEQININVYDVSGKEIFLDYTHQNMTNYQKIKLNFSNVSEGNYLVLITINQIITKNLTVIKKSNF
jgi:Secretion system C-terminal sorting domain